MFLEHIVLINIAKQEEVMKYLLKRIMDIILAGIACIILLPIMVIIALAVKLDSKGTVIFKQDRLAKHGELFEMYKFRTMIENAEHMGAGLFNFKDDFRVTRVGNFLRRTSLDELPQFFNVLKGDMSLVGPRPPVSYELGDYDSLSDLYKLRFEVSPGITGLSQVSGRNEISWDEKVIYDKEYIEQFDRFGVLIDIVILFKTVLSVFKTKEVYEEKDEAYANFSDEEIAKLAAQKVADNAKKED